MSPVRSIISHYIALILWISCVASAASADAGPPNEGDAGGEESAPLDAEGALDAGVLADEPDPVDAAAQAPAPQASSEENPEYSAEIKLAEPNASGAPPSAPAAPAAPDYGATAYTQRPPGPGEFAPGGTASKLNVPLEELPATVSSVDHETLRERGVVDLQQALGLIPGVMPLWTYGGFQHVSVRGFQALPLVDGRRDSRPILVGSAPTAGLYDLERIEVLRGPAAVLYGYGAVGGVINMIRKRASLRPSHELELGLGTPGQYRIHAGSQGQILPKLSYRADLAHVRYRNFRGYQSERNQVTTSLRYTPSWRQQLQLRVAYSFDRYNTDVGIPTIEDPKHPGRWMLPPGARLENRYSSENDHLQYQRFEVALDYRYDLTKEIYFEARGAITQDRYHYLAAESLTYVPPMGDVKAQVEREYLSFAHRFRPAFAQTELHADVHTGPLLHKLLVGYQLDHMVGSTNRNSLGGATPGAVDFVWPIDRADKVADQRSAIDKRRHIVHSLYAFDHIKLSPSLILTGGGRLDFVRSGTRRVFLDVETQDEIADPKTGMRRRTNRKQDFAATGQAGLVFTPWKPVTMYGSYASGFLPKFVSASAAAITRYEPERTQQFEGGLRLRGERRSHVAELDAAGFLIRKRNLVVPRGVDDFTQAGLAQSRGVDLNVRYRAPRFVQLEGGYSFADAEYKKFVGPSAVTGENVNLAGNTLRLAPRHSGGAWLRLPLAERLQLGVGTRVMGRQWADDENRLRMPRYALLDASIGYGTEHARFILSGNNLLDHLGYFSSVINSGSPQPQVTPGPGREILGTLILSI